MNIQLAKKEVENAVKSYLLKDNFGNYKTAIVRQRPLFIIGPPGIGKTAIMEQIAQEMEIGIVSYSMTHHTRQSAIGLPFIAKKIYAEKEYSVSEYTMSEIVSTVYGYIEETGIKEGVLFLDEINCVSETLSPAMLQFLQYKTFGNHKIPEGWVIVTAGNPPEFNKSVREFDVVTLDRVRKIDVEADFVVWKEYGLQTGIHGSIITFLEIKRDYFYSIETTIDGKLFVTARAWEDLSKTIELYEELEIEIDENLCSQYIQNPKITKEFTIYYNLYNKYKTDYKVLEILDGKYSEEIKERAVGAKFDERVTLLGLLIDTVTNLMKKNLIKEMYTEKVYDVLKSLKGNESDLENLIEGRKKVLAQKVEKVLINKENENIEREVIATLEIFFDNISQKNLDSKKAFAYMKKEFEKTVSNLEKEVEQTKEKAENTFKFVEDVFGKGEEMVLLVSEMTANKTSANFIGKYNVEKYFENNKEMLFYERGQEILKDIALLDGMMK